MLDGRAGDDYHRWFLRDQLGTPVVRLCLFSGVLEYEVPAWADTDEAAPVVRADVAQIDEVIEHLRVTLLHRGVLCSLRALSHPQKA